MQCDHIQQQLNALADGELNHWQKRRIQRHLRHCTVCSDELAAIQQIGDQAKAWRRIDAPAALSARIAQMLTASQADDSLLSLTHEENSTMHTPNSALSSPQSLDNQSQLNTRKRAQTARRYPAGLNWRPIAALSGLGIALAVMALFLLPTRKSFAFAAVVQAMEKVRTVHWTVKANGFTPPGFGLEGNGELTVLEAWASLDKPAYALLAGPDGLVKVLMTPGKQIVMTDGKVIMEMPMPGFEALGKNKEEGMRAFILGQVVSPTTAAAMGAGEKDSPDLLNASGQNDGFQREEVVLEGKRVVRFFSDTKFGEGRFTHSLWVDPETHLVVRSETHMPNPVKGQPELVAIAAQFRYNEQPPVGIFDLPAK